MPKAASVGTLACALALVACGPGASTADAPARGAPSDDPADYDVDTSVAYEVRVSEPRWVVPSAALPPEAAVQAANNNVDIQFHGDRLFLAWRTAPNHFASRLAELLVISSADGGATWELEHRVALGTDVREPRLLSYRGELQLLFFEAGKSALAFAPVRMWRTFRRGRADWGPPEVVIDEPEVPWDVKVRGGLALMTSYQGAHYDPSDGATVQVFLKSSDDGRRWDRVDDRPFVYEGGVSEVAFEIDADGSLWAVTRNEDGDATGLGSHVCQAPAHALADWDCPDRSDPNRYDSPELFRHGDDLYLVARRDVDGLFGEEDGALGPYSLRPKRTALYRVDRAGRTVVPLMDLPGAGDTAFPAVRRTGAHTFLLANYTSPLDAPDISWLEGQTSGRGTRIYLLDLAFVPAR